MSLKGSTRGVWLRNFHVLVGGIASLNRFVLSDFMLRLGKGGTLGCPKLAAALGVRMYSLKNP